MNTNAIVFVNKRTAIEIKKDVSFWEGEDLEEDEP